VSVAPTGGTRRSRPIRGGSLPRRPHRPVRSRSVVPRGRSRMSGLRRSMRRGGVVPSEGLSGGAPGTHPVRARGS